MGQEFACQMPLGDQEMIPVTVTLDLAEWQMLLDMFATIEEHYQLGADMFRLYAHLKEQLPVEIIEKVVKA